MDKSGFSFIPDGGEMGRLIRTKDWTQSAVGPVSNWPQSLRTTLSIVINTKFPMMLMWGKDLICFYNDAFRPSLGNEGKHPFILGMPAIEAWREVWDFTQPLFNSVMEKGEAVWYENQLVPIYRNGKLESVYWTFSYSPVTNEEDQIAGILVTVVETTETVKLLSHLNTSEKRYRSVVEAATVATAVFSGPEMVLEIANDISFKNWEKDRSVIGKPLLDFFPELNGQVYPTLMQEVFRTGVPHIEHEAMVRRKRGDSLETFYVDFSYQALRNDQGEIDGILALSSDVTEKYLTRKKLDESRNQLSLALENQVRERTQELHEKNMALQKMNEELKSFAHVSSHDLQEPLRKILTFTDRIMENDAPLLSEEGKQNFNRIFAAAQRMRRLIEDLLTYSRASTMDYGFEDVNLDQVLNDVKDELQETIVQKKARIASNQLGTHKMIGFQFHQLFLNLIANSLKYSSASLTPHIEILGEITNGYISDGQSIDPGNKYFHLSFTDNGIGFEKQYSESIFKIFYRLHNNVEYSGTGIGLAIVKKIVENHRGSVYAESEPGKGSVFHIYLPQI